ncbi:MAG: helix-turn-helix domain-containing protein [Gammaproteobacteria bacterium]
MLLTVAQAAERLAVCRKTVRRAIDRGDLPVVRLGETRRADRIHPDDLEN